MMTAQTYTRKERINKQLKFLGYALICSLIDLAVAAVWVFVVLFFWEAFLEASWVPRPPTQALFVALLALTMLNGKNSHEEELEPKYIARRFWQPVGVFIFFWVFNFVNQL